MSDQRLEFTIAAIAKTREATAQVLRDLDAIGGETKKLRSELRQVGDTSGLTKIRQAATDLRAAFAKIKPEELKQLGGTLTAAVTLPIVGLGAAAVKAAVDLDSLKRGLSAVAGGSAQAEAQMIRLREVAKLPGLGFKEAIQGSINLQAAGLSAELAEQALMGFGNALATVGKGKADLMGVITALSQIESKGKVSAEEINQLAERVPQIRQVMKAAFGTSDTEELQNRGISSEEFIGKVVAALGKLPKATGGAANDFENLADSVDQSMSRIGKAILPFASRGATDLANAAEGISKAFAELPGPAQTAALAITAIAAAAGPAVYGLGQLIQSWRTLKSVMTGGAVANAAAGLTGAAAGAGAGASAAGSAASRAALAATPGTYAAVGATGTGAIVAGIAAAVVAGITAAHFANVVSDNARGIKSHVNFGDTTGELGLNPAYHPGADTTKSIEEQQAAFRAARAAGQSPHQQIAAAQAARKAQVAADVSLAADERFGAQAQFARTNAATAPEGHQAGALLAGMAPLILQRQQELEKQAKELAPNAQKSEKAAKEFYGVQKEYWANQGSLLELQRDAEKEKQDQTAHAMELQDAIGATQIEYANALMAQVPENERAQAALQLVLPQLRKNQETLLQAAQQFNPQQKEYWENVRGFWQVEKQAQDIQRAAVEEREKNAKDALKKQFAQRGRGIEIAKIQAGMLSDQAAEGNEARGQARELIPVLDAELENVIIPQLEQYAQDSDEYFDALKQYWETQREIQRLQAGSEKEYRESFKKAATERRALMDAQLGLAEAQLKNMFGLTDRQKKEGLLPLLKEKFKGLMQPVTGEKDLDRIQRLTQAEGTRSDIFDALGLTGKQAELAGGGQIPLYDTRRVKAVNDELARSSVTINTPITVQSGGADPNWIAKQFQAPAFQSALQEFLLWWQSQQPTNANLTYQPGF